MKRFLMYFKSKTVWGGLLMALPDLVNVISTGVIGPKAATIAQGVGTILVAVGVKSAINKAAGEE